MGRAVVGVRGRGEAQLLRAGVCRCTPTHGSASPSPSSLPPSLPPSPPPPPPTARLVNEDDPWAQEPGFLAEVMVAAYERRRSQVRVWVGGRCGRWDSAAAGGGRPFHALCTLLPCLQADAISEMPLYPTEAVLFDENQVPSMHYTGRCTGAARAVAGGLCGRWWFMEAVRARMTPACMPAGPPPSLSTSRNPRQAPLPTPPPPPPHPPTPTHPPTHPHPHTLSCAAIPAGEGVLALPKLNLQFLTFHDYMVGGWART